MIDRELKISENGILDLDNLPFSKNNASFDINISLLIINSKITENSFMKNMHSLQLMDLHRKYYGFLINYKEEESIIGDIITIYKIAIALFKEKLKIYFIKNYKIEKTGIRIIKSISENKYFPNINTSNNSYEHLNKYVEIITDYENNKNLNQNTIKSINENEYDNNNKEIMIINENENNNKETIMLKNNENENNKEKDNYKNKQKYHYKNDISDIIIDENVFNDSSCSLLSNLNSFSINIHIYVKCLIKAPIKYYSSKYSGKYFNLIFSDKLGNEICCIVFNNNIDVLFNKFEEGNYYEIKGGHIETNSKYFLTNIPYKLVLDKNIEIKKIENNKIFKERKYDCKSIEEIKTLPKYTIIDFFGYIISIYVSSNGINPRKKITLIDNLGYKIELYLWNTYFKQNIEINHFIGIKNIRIYHLNEFINLNSIDSTIITIDPVGFDDQKNEIKKYISTNNIFKNIINKNIYGNNNQIYLETEYIKDILHKNDINPDEIEKKTFKLKGTFINIFHCDKSYYLGCKFCKRKINIIMDDKFYCEYCNSNFCNPEYFFSIPIEFIDVTQKLNLSLMNNIAKDIIGISINEYKNIIQSNDIKSLNEINKKLLYKDFYIYLKLKNRVYNDKLKINFYIYKIEEVDSKMESNNIIKLLNKKL